MNIEILSHRIPVNESYNFQFSDTVQRYMVGFSWCKIEYQEGKDNHAQEIAINLQNAINNGPVVTVTPELVLHDKHYSSQSRTSSIEVVVIAKVGTGNDELYIRNGIDAESECQLPFDNITFLYSSLLHCKAYYSTKDYHVHKFNSSVQPSTNDKNFILHGKTRMNDVKKHASNGVTIGNIIAYSGKSRNILSAPFDSKRSGKLFSIDIGKAPRDFNPDNCQVGCFISGFSLSFGSHVDHHIMSLELGCNLVHPSISVKNGNVYLEAAINAVMLDKHFNGYGEIIPANELSGFFILVHKRKF